MDSCNTGSLMSHTYGIVVESRVTVPSFLFAIMAHHQVKRKLIAVIGDEVGIGMGFEARELTFRCQDTCTGFMLGGIGEINQKRQPNFLLVKKGVTLAPPIVSNTKNRSFLDTTRAEIEEAFVNFMKREDIGIILINQYVRVPVSYYRQIWRYFFRQIGDEIRHLLDQNTASIPAVLEIPSKEHPYDPSKDSILRRAKVLIKRIKKFFSMSTYTIGNVQSG